MNSTSSIFPFLFESTTDGQEGPELAFYLQLRCPETPRHLKIWCKEEERALNNTRNTRVISLDAIKLFSSLVNKNISRELIFRHQIVKKISTNVMNAINHTAVVPALICCRSRFAGFCARLFHLANLTTSGRQNDLCRSPV